jgi:hypothetical protein
MPGPTLLVGPFPLLPVEFFVASLRPGDDPKGRCGSGERGPVGGRVGFLVGLERVDLS